MIGDWCRNYCWARCSFVCLRFTIISVVTAKKNAMPSDAAMLAQTPSIPKYLGIMRRNGKRNMSWRVSERNIESFGLPTDWKKF